MSADVTGVERTAARPTAPSELLRRPLVAGLVLLVAYVALSMLMSPRGYLGTDTGGKVATLEAMSDHGSLEPDVGYWAADQDPDATLHGLYYTSRVGDRYLNVTSLPMIYAALPLYELGGYRLALLVPMLGGVACAFAARAIARRVSSGDGWAAFWVVGLASPVTIYALDLWEHTIGAALMAWGIVALLDAVTDRPTWWRGVLAGAAFGAAFTMRTESLVYGFVAVGVTCVVLLVRGRELRSPLLVGLTAGAGFAAVAAVNALGEIALLGSTIRASRATGTASALGKGGVGLRLDEAFVTTGSLFPSSERGRFLLVVALVALLAFVAHRTSRRGDRVPAYLAAGAVVALYLLRMVDGLGFVPGLVAATPFAAAALALAWRRTAARLAAAIALLALPLVWATDFVGGAVPQWGGRYILTTGLVLGAIGVARSEACDRWARNLLLGLAIGVTAFGLLWMVQRTHEVADAGAWIAARPEPVVVSTEQFWLRESGSYEPHERWLTLARPSDLDRAAGIVTAEGFDSFGLLSIDRPGVEPPAVPGFAATSTGTEQWLGVDFRYTVYERQPVP